jgi:hypothetical protein
LRNSTNFVIEKIFYSMVKRVEMSLTGWSPSQRGDQGRQIWDPGWAPAPHPAAKHTEIAAQ